MLGTLLSSDNNDSGSFISVLGVVALVATALYEALLPSCQMLEAQKMFHKIH